jgi:hypothetical protein
MAHQAQRRTWGRRSAPPASGGESSWSLLLVLAHPSPIRESASDVDALDRTLEALARLPVPARDRQRPFGLLDLVRQLVEVGIGR